VVVEVVRVEKQFRLLAVLAAFDFEEDEPGRVIG
jgi:hypothetical protein